MISQILMVDNDPLLCDSLGTELQRAGYRVQTAGSAEEGLNRARRERPDLVLLEMGLPGMDGLEALRCFQAELDVPVIFLAAPKRKFDEVLGLEMGAEDYIAKPFDEDVLLARIKAALRRARRWAAADRTMQELVVGDLTINPAARTVTLEGETVDLPARAFDLLHVLATHAGHVVSLDDLLTRVWGPEYIGEPQAVYVYIRWLREKLEVNPSHPRRIVTIRGAGYKLVTPED